MVQVVVILFASRREGELISSLGCLDDHFAIMTSQQEKPRVLRSFTKMDTLLMCGWGSSAQSLNESPESLGKVSEQLWAHVNSEKEKEKIFTSKKQLLLWQLPPHNLHKAQANWENFELAVYFISDKIIIPHYSKPAGKVPRRTLLPEVYALRTTKLTLHKKN